MEKNIRKMVESLYTNNLKDLQKALKSLLETPEGQDYVIVILKEAIDNGHLLSCETAAIISGIIAEMSPCREILLAIADGINDPNVSRDPAWIDDIIFQDVDIPAESRQDFWQSIDRVQEVRRLIKEVARSNAASADSGDTASAAGAPPDANTDIWPEHDNGAYIDDMGYINYI